MATTNSTANYNLPQWTADDKVGIMANLNPAFNTIDQKLHEAVVNADNASTVSSSASQVANSANTLANKVDGEMTEVQADILTLQNLVNSLQKTIDKNATWEPITITLPKENAIAESAPSANVLGDLLISIHWAKDTLNKSVNISSNDTLFILPFRPSSRRSIENFIRYSKTDGNVIEGVHLETDGRVTANHSQNNVSSVSIEKVLSIKTWL